MRSYVDKALVEGETVQARSHYHWTSWILPVAAVLLPIVFWLAAFALFGPLVRAWLDWLWLGLFVAGLLYFLWEFVRLRSTEIAVTNRRFIRKSGWIARDTSELALRNIEEVKLDQTILGRLLGYGKITLRGTGGGIVENPGVDDPKTLQKQLQVAIAAAQPPRDPVERKA